MHVPAPLAAPSRAACLIPVVLAWRRLVRRGLSPPLPCRWVLCPPVAARRVARVLSGAAWCCAKARPAIPCPSRARRAPVEPGCAGAVCAGRVCVCGLCGLRQSPRARPDAAQRLCLVLASQDLAEELAAPLPPARRGVSLSLACRLALARAAPSQTRSILDRIIKVSKQPARLENTFGRCFPDTMPGAGAHIKCGRGFYTASCRWSGLVWVPQVPPPPTVSNSVPRQGWRVHVGERAPGVATSW